MSKSRIIFIKDNPECIEILRCNGIRFSKNISNYWKGKKFSKEHKKNISYTRIKNKVAKLWNNPKWKGGKSYEPYGLEFNNKLKKSIRKKYNYECQLCKKLQTKPKLDIHHIDENKQNNNSNNLISLCHYCHILLHNKKIKLKKNLLSQTLGVEGRVEKPPMR